MSLGTLYTHIKEGDGPFTRTVLPEHLVKYYKIDSIKIASGPDEHYPKEFPYAKVPAFRFKDGTQLMESVPIVLMIVDQLHKSGGLIGNQTPAEFSQVLMWMNRFNFDFMQVLTTPFKMVMGAIPFDQAQWDASTAGYTKELDLYEKYLLHHTFLVGESVTIADLYAATMFLRPLVRLFDKDFRAKYPSVMRWFETVKVHPVFQGFFDNLEYLDVFKMPSH